MDVCHVHDGLHRTPLWQAIWGDKNEEDLGPQGFLCGMHSGEYVWLAQGLPLFHYKPNRGWAGA